MACENIQMISVHRSEQADQRGRLSSVARLLISSSLLLGACGPSGAAPADNVKTQAGNSKPRYAVAGMAPGMTASEISLAAGRAGYRAIREDAGPDWQSEMSLATSGKKFDLLASQRGIREQEFRRGGESITIGYVAMPPGPVAVTVSYAAPLAALEFHAANIELTKRYGKSSFSNTAASSWAQWCSNAVRTAQDCLKSSFLTLKDGASGVTIYTADERIREEQKRALQKMSGGKASF